MAKLTPRHNVWIEQGDVVVLSVWRVRLLEAVAETGSLNAAAARLDVSYHRAWEKLHEMENALGVRLVEMHTGGVHGGGARLTPAGQDFIRRFHAFYDGLPGLIARRFEKAFGKAERGG